MSFARIAVSRAVKQIVEYIRSRATVRGEGPLAVVADEIEAGEWKDVQVPRGAKKKKKAKAE